MAGFRPSQVVDRHRRGAREGLHDDPQPGAQEAGPADQRERAPEAHRLRAARGAPRGRAGDHVGDGTAACRRPARPRRRDRRRHRRLCAHQPGRVPGPPRQDRDLQRVRAARPSRGAAERGLAARPGAARDRRRAVCRGAGARPRAGAPGRSAVRRCRWRDDRRRARAPGWHRGDPDVRARWSGVHEVARRPAGPAVSQGRGAQGRLRARACRSSRATRWPASSATTCGSGRRAWSS